MEPMHGRIYPELFPPYDDEEQTYNGCRISGKALFVEHVTSVEYVKLYFSHFRTIGESVTICSCAPRSEMSLSQIIP
jgi:hypothetical protein